MSMEQLDPEKQKAKEQLENEVKKDRYHSQDGFVVVPVIRGFGEIKKLWDLIQELNTNCIILGGYVRYMCSPLMKPPETSDVDLYCPEREDFEKMIECFKEMDMTVTHENDVALVYAQFERHDELFPCPQINLVKPMAEGVIVTQGSLEEIINNFDFTVIRIGLLNPTEALADADFLHDEEAKELRIKNIHCPVSSFYRVMKYRMKGYWPPSSLIIKILQNWHDRDEDYRKEILDFFAKAENEKIEQEEIDRMEKLMRLVD